MLTLATLFGLAAVSNIESSYIKLIPSDNAVMKGDQFMIGVYAGAHTPVNAVDIEINFSPDMVEVLGVDKGQSVLTIWAEEPLVENDSIRLSGGTFRRGFVGEHLVATIKAEAKLNGLTEFTVNDVQLLAGDGKGSEVAIDDDVSGKTSFYIYNQGEDEGEIKAALGISINPDINGDGKVTLSDISAFLSAWHDNSRVYDFNGDNKMSFVDFSIILAKSFFN